MKKNICFNLLLFCGFIFGQNGSNVYTFLNLPISARQAALGGDAISISDDDIAFTIANPSLMNKEADLQLSINASTYLADSKYGTLAFGKDLDNGHMIMANARYMNYGNIPRTDAAGQDLGNFTASDIAVGAGYAFQFEKNWTIGGSLNFITSTIDQYQSSAIAGNAGITYRDKKAKESVSIIFRNFGYQIKSYNGERELLPFRIDLGATKTLEMIPLAITITVHDLQKFDISSPFNNNNQEVKIGRKIADHFSIGAELFPERNFSLRIGYNVKRGNEMAVVDQRNFSGISGGFGLRVSRFKIDYAHMRFHNASNTHLLGLSINLSKQKK